MGVLLRASAALGAVASLYAVYIEHEIAAAAAAHLDFEAPCDVGGFSCSRVLSSEYSHPLSALGLLPRGHAFDVSNALAGLAWYIFAGTAAPLLLPPAALLALSVGSLAYSGFLLWILKYVLHDTCIICITMYAANIGIFAAAARDVVKGMGRRGKGSKSGESSRGSILGPSQGQVDKAKAA